LPPKNARSKLLQEPAAQRDAAREAQGPVLRPAPPTKPRRTARIAVAGALPPAHIPAEALRSPPTQGLFATALTISLVLHLVVAAVHFSPFDFTRFKDNEPPLEIALVNAKSNTKPTKADILAQANLDGGGNTDLSRRAKTPLPVLPNETPGKDVSVAAQSAEARQEQRPDVLTRKKSTAVVQLQPTPVDAAPEKTDSPTANDLMQKALEAIRLEAQIAKDMDAYQKRPKRTFIGARATEFRFARYVEDWRLKIERIGNLNYPEVARQQKLYGSLLLTVSIRSDGTIENVEVNRTSGQRILDAAAVKIVQMSAPFASFPPDIRRDTDILHITRTWTFAKGDELTSQ
jgi:protein TonB